MIRSLLLALALVATPALAQEGAPTAPTFGGCNGTGKLCFGPSVLLGISAINLSSGKFEGGFVPGVGYGMTYLPGSWKSVGADFFANVDPEHNVASLAICGSFLNGYFRPGISKSFLNDHSWRFLWAGTGVALP